MNKCVKCTQPIADGVKFCTECGASAYNCSSCAKSLPNGVKFCPNCGTSVPGDAYFVVKGTEQQEENSPSSTPAYAGTLFGTVPEDSGAAAMTKAEVNKKIAQKVVGCGCLSFVGLMVFAIVGFVIMVNSEKSKHEASEQAEKQAETKLLGEIKGRYRLQDPDFSSYSSVESQLDKVSKICAQIGYGLDRSMGLIMSRCERDILKIDTDLEFDKRSSHTYTSSDFRNKWEEALDSLAQDEKDSSARKEETKRRESLGDHTEQ